MSYGYETRMKPSEIRFIQDSISTYFQDGKDIHDSIRKIANGVLSPYHFPPIKVVHKDWKTYSFDNRRLYVFRVCEYLGFIYEISVHIRPIWELRPDKFTTDDDGRTVYVRRGQTFPHCKDEWFREPDTAGNWNLPAQTVPEAKKVPENIDTTDGRLSLDHNANDTRNTENVTDGSNVFSASCSKNSSSPSSRSASRSNNLSIVDYPSSSNVVVPKATSTISRPPSSSSHSSRVYIAANIGENDRNKPVYLSQRTPSAASCHNSNVAVSIVDGGQRKQDSSGETALDVVIVTEPQRNWVTSPIKKVGDSSRKDGNTDSCRKKSIFERVYEICCCCCASKSASDD